MCFLFDFEKLKKATSVKERAQALPSTEHYYITILPSYDSGAYDRLAYIIINKHTGVPELETSVFHQAVASLHEFTSIFDKILASQQEQVTNSSGTLSKEEVNSLLQDTCTDKPGC